MYKRFIFIVLVLFAVAAAMLYMASNRIDAAVMPQTKVKSNVQKSGPVVDRYAKVRGHRYTQRQLDNLNDRIWKRLEELKNTDLLLNISGGDVDTRFINIWLRRNTAEWRKEFRRIVCASPAVRFKGHARPVVDESVGVSDTLGLTLCPEYNVFADTASRVQFVLSNRSGYSVSFGTDYHVSFLDTDGVWRKLPGQTIFTALGLGLSNNCDHIFSASLFPRINHNRPGRYRYFHEVRLNGKQTIEVMLMAEFWLSDSPKELSKAVKNAIPPRTTANGIDSTLTPLFTIVEEMPSFPGGDAAYLEWAKANAPHSPKGTKRGVYRFIVEKDGSISDITTVRSASKTLDRQAVEMLGRMPKWIPGRQNGKPVRVLFTVPVQFNP